MLFLSFVLGRVLGIIAHGRAFRHLYIEVGDLSFLHMSGLLLNCAPEGAIEYYTGECFSMFHGGIQQIVTPNKWIDFVECNTDLQN